jgi:hypothetical protein
MRRWPTRLQCTDEVGHHGLFIAIFANKYASTLEVRIVVRDKQRRRKESVPYIVTVSRVAKSHMAGGPDSVASDLDSYSILPGKPILPCLPWSVDTFINEGWELILCEGNHLNPFA